MTRVKHNLSVCLRCDANSCQGMRITYVLSSQDTTARDTFGERLAPKPSLWTNSELERGGGRHGHLKETVRRHGTGS